MFALFKPRQHPVHTGVRFNANLSLAKLRPGMQLTHCTDYTKATLVYMDALQQDFLLVGADGALLTPDAATLLADYCHRGDKPVRNLDKVWALAAAVFEQDRRILTRLGFRNHPLKIRAALQHTMRREGA